VKISVNKCRAGHAKFLLDAAESPAAVTSVYWKISVNGKSTKFLLDAAESRLLSSTAQIQSTAQGAHNGQAI
jgi:hypothetical protein